MHGVILAGGTGSRVGSSTKAVNKHCLPVYDRPMIEWAACVLHHNSVGPITIVTSPDGVAPLSRVMGDHYNYRVQSTPGGTAQALACAETSSSSPIMVILGDNIFLPPLQIHPRDDCAYCVLHSSPRHNLTQFGVAVIGGEPARVVNIVEKPPVAPSKFLVTGLYIFPAQVFADIRQLGTSHRGEIEITDLLNIYADRKLLIGIHHKEFWGDAGTPNGLLECSVAAKQYIEDNR